MCTKEDSIYSRTYHKSIIREITRRDSSESGTLITNIS
jgi:hypothetical protein